jgi:hypothetical protein
MKTPLLRGWRRPPPFQPKNRRRPPQAQPPRRPLSIKAVQARPQLHSRRLSCRWLQLWLPLFSSFEPCLIRLNYMTFVGRPSRLQPHSLETFSSDSVRYHIRSVHSGGACTYLCN